MSPNLCIARMCYLMHWTYDEYMAQPEWLVDGINDIINAEAKYQKLENKRAEKQWQRSN